jgi:hypothetical protein
MTTRKTKSNYDQVANQAQKGKRGVQNFADFAGQSNHVRFDEMIDQTIYITQLDILASDQYGSGYKVHFKDLPNAAQTMTAGVFGKYPIEQLDNLYKMTHDGKLISPETPVRTKIVQAGKTYRFE